MTQSNGADDRPMVFLSHRHQDRALAQVLYDFIRENTQNLVDIHKSSDYEGHAPAIGKPLAAELARSLRDAELVLLVYTRSGADWSYPIWEAGVAFNPDWQEQTAIAVLASGNEVPAPLEHLVRVSLNDENSVKRFVTEFLTGTRLFPKHGRPVTGFSTEDPVIAQKGEDLFQRLEHERRAPAARVFIAHREADSRIVDALRDVLEGEIGSTTVTQSPPDGWFLGLNPTLTQSVGACDRIVLVQTGSGTDFAHTVWQAALGVDPEARERVPLTLLHVGQVDVASLDAEYHAVNMNDPDSVQDFVRRFTTEPDYFPGRGRALTSWRRDAEQVARVGETLFEAWRDVVPTSPPPDQSWLAHPWMRLGLDLTDVDALTAAAREGDHEQVPRMVRERCHVLDNNDQALSLLGVFHLGENRSLAQLIDIVEGAAEPSDHHWLVSVVDQVSQAAQWKTPRANWARVQEDQSGHIPVLTRVTKSPEQGRMEFEIVVLKFDITVDHEERVIRVVTREDGEAVAS